MNASHLALLIGPDFTYPAVETFAGPSEKIRSAPECVHCTGRAPQREYKAAGNRTYAVPQAESPSGVKTFAVAVLDAISGQPDIEKCGKPTCLTPFGNERSIFLCCNKKVAATKEASQYCSDGCRVAEIFRTNSLSSSGSRSLTAQ